MKMSLHWFCLSSLMTLILATSILGIYTWDCKFTDLRKILSTLPPNGRILVHFQKYHSRLAALFEHATLFLVPNNIYEIFTGSKINIAPLSYSKHSVTKVLMAIFLYLTFFIYFSFLTIIGSKPRFSNAHWSASECDNGA